MNLIVECVDDDAEGFYRVILEDGSSFEAEELGYAFNDALTFLGFKIQYKDVEEYPL
jgi:hypothetical protein